MTDYRPSAEEAEFLAHYDPGAWPRPSVTADVVFLAGPKSGRRVLLIRRGGFPYRGWWALPGGFCEPGESPDRAAARELAEETGLSGTALTLVGVFGEAGRDPRGWTVTCAYLARADVPPAARAGDDAAAEGWFSVLRRALPPEGGVRAERLTLTCGGTVLSADVAVGPAGTRLPESSFAVLRRDGLAFDHARILAAALCRADEEEG